MSTRGSFFGVALFALGFTHGVGAAELGVANQSPQSAQTEQEIWEEAQRAIRQFQIPEGFAMDVFAVEPQLQNPVAFHVDDQGRVYVSETHRYRTSALDIRHYMGWYLDDLASRTVEDRVAVIKKHMGDNAGELAKQSEIVRLVEDTDGDGRADSSKVFAGGFDTLLDGIASGVLARGKDVYFANIPNLWRLRDEDQDGHADSRESLSYGYGVHFSLTGHDLHGLIVGPDGKLYFTVGDRGAHVETREGKTLAYPDMGATFRCNLDGSELEVFAIGQRNPQELAFDKYGNLFTGDNNCDHGDRARWVHVVEGGDSGWRVGFQFSEQNPAGIWNAERLWHLQFPTQAAYIVPPIAHISSGPSGLTYNPGTGMPNEYADHFFLCDFRGSAANSGVHTFSIEPKGASFEMVNPRHFLWNILLTDFDFGPDGRLYMTDWVHGWPKSDKGRIYRLAHAESLEKDVTTQTATLLHEGLEGQSRQNLFTLLEHPDMRIRLRAQFALADQNARAIPGLRRIATNANADQLARIHAIWAFGQILDQARREEQNALFTRVARITTPLLDDADPEIRAQTAKVLGDNRVPRAYNPLLAALKDESPRVQFFAAQGLGKLKRRDAVEPVFELLAANNDEDVYLRHAAVMALVGIANIEALTAAAEHPSPAVRMGAALALRRLEHPRISRFLDDENPLVQAEAARGINDVPIKEAYPALAQQLNRAKEINGYGDDSSEWSIVRTAILRRVMNAHYRLGSEDGSRGLAALATSPEFTDALRIEAIGFLGDWLNPSPRDQVTGLWNPVSSTRSIDQRATAEAMGTLLKEESNPVRMAAAETIGKLRLMELEPQLFGLLSDDGAPGVVRSEALKALAALESERIEEALDLAAQSFDTRLRTTAVRLQSSVRPGQAAEKLALVLDNGSIGEKQAALAALSQTSGSVADELILGWLGDLLEGTLPKELQLDVYESAAARADQRIKDELQQLAEKYSAHGENALDEHLLYGGDAENGKKVFFERAEAACLRCHKIDGEGGEVGPDLSKVGEKGREHILESLLYPNKQISPGFENIIISQKNGLSVAGIIKNETDDVIELLSPEDGLITVKKENVASRQPGLSGMPDGITLLLTKHDIRDLLEYLSQLK